MNDPEGCLEKIVGFLFLGALMFRGAESCARTGVRPARLSIPEQRGVDPVALLLESCDGGQDQHPAVAAQVDHKVDGTRRTLESVDSENTPAYPDGYAIGGEVQVTATFSEPVDTFPDGAFMDLEFTLADSTAATREMQADGVTSTTTVIFRYTVTDEDLGTDMKVPADPFGTQMPDMLDQVTTTTTPDDLLVNSPAALNIVDKESNCLM